MIIKPLARARLLAALSFSATACGTDPADVPLVDGGTNDSGTVDANIPDVECDGKNVGFTERRVRYQAASVPSDGECVAQEQARVCETDGTWTEWTGDYEAESCSVAGLAGCDGQPHGTEQTRDRYQLESVAFGEQCTKQSQSRECGDGKWSDWSGSYTFEQCQVKGAASCDQTPHGEEQTRLRYESLAVPYGSLCRPETQSRDCENGTFSPWSGTLTAESCRVLDALSCGNSPHGTEEKRTRFESSLVESGECQAQEQTRTCGNGAWSDWSGTFTAEICEVEGKRRCGSTLHGEDEKRLRYERAEEPYGVDCVSEQQARVCNNGTFGAWSGSYEAETCGNAAPADCDTGKHGDVKTRTRFGAESVPYGTTCPEQIQNSTCTNGVWGPYSGTFTAETCSVAPPASCDGVEHGDKGSRTYYQAAMVPFGQTCVSELQERTCNNGVWGAYSGTFTAPACTVADKVLLTCDQHTTLALGVCHEFSGPNATADINNVCHAGTRGAGCPASAIGRCDLSTVGTNPPGYVQWHYLNTYFTDKSVSEKLCKDSGGTWSAP